MLYRISNHNFPKAQSSRIREGLMQSTRFSLLQSRSLIAINRRLLEIGIRPVWLKGVVLAHSLYDAPYLRPMADMDLIVAAEDYEQAIDAVLAMGYQAYETELEASPNRLSHHQHLFDSESALLHIEIHHRLLGHSGQDYIPVSVLGDWLQNPSRFQIKGEDFYCLPPEAHFLYLCAHAFLQHGEASIKLRHLLDLDLILRKTSLDWPCLIDTAVDLRWTYLLAHALSRLQSVFQSPLPPAILETLAAKRPDDENIALVQTLSSGDIRGEKILRLFSQMSISERLKMSLRIAFPPQDYMRRRYDITAEKAVWPYYLYRWGDQLKGIVVALRKRLDTKR